MAMATLIRAIQTKWAALTFTGKPTNLWYGLIPLTNTAAAANSLPLCWIEYKKTDYKATLEGNAFLTYNFELRASDDDNALVEAIAFGFLFNTGSPSDRSGFAFTSTLEVPAGFEFLSCECSSSFTVMPSKKRDGFAMRAYELTLPFIIQVQKT